MTNYDILKEYEAHKTPVPSYEEWQKLKEASDGVSKLMFKSLMNRFVKADEERERLLEENQQLKELLKECRSSVLFEADVMKETSGKHSKDYKMLASILTKIDNAMRE